MASAGSGLVSPFLPGPVQDEIGRLAFRSSRAGEQPPHLRDRYGNQFFIQTVMAFFTPCSIACFLVTDKYEGASISKVMCRYKPSHFRTSYWSTPTCLLASSKHSSMAHPVPPARTSSSRLLPPGQGARNRPFTGLGKAATGQHPVALAGAPGWAVFPWLSTRRPGDPWRHCRRCTAPILIRQPSTPNGQPAPDEALCRSGATASFCSFWPSCGNPSRCGHCHRLRSLPRPHPFNHLGTC